MGLLIGLIVMCCCRKKKKAKAPKKKEEKIELLPQKKHEKEVHAEPAPVDHRRVYGESRIYTEDPKIRESKVFVEEGERVLVEKRTYSPGKKPVIETYPHQSWDHYARENFNKSYADAIDSHQVGHQVVESYQPVVERNVERVVSHGHGGNVRYVSHSGNGHNPYNPYNH